MDEPEYEVVWSGGELMPPAPQMLYEIQMTGKRNPVTLGLVRFGERGRLVRDASVDRLRAPKQKWALKSSLRKQLAVAATVTDRTAAYRDRAIKQHPKVKQAVLDAAMVRLIRRAYEKGEGGFGLLGKRFGVSAPTIGQIIHRDTWRHVL